MSPIIHDPQHFSKARRIDSNSQAEIINHTMVSYIKDHISASYFVAFILQIGFSLLEGQPSAQGFHLGRVDVCNLIPTTASREVAFRI